METLLTTAKADYLPTNNSKQMLGIKLDVRTETAPLEAVVVGLAIDEGTAHLQNNPKMIEHVKNGTYPGEDVLEIQVGNLVRAMQKEGVIVYRPTNVKKVNQIFTRDIGFVVDNTFVIANMKRDNRKLELDGIQHVIDLLNPKNVIRATGDATFEGGDVLVHNEHIFVGISKRTNWAGYEFLKKSFPNKQVHALEVLVTDDAHTNILHLDCTFQPVGGKFAIFYEEGFVKKPQIIYDVFGEDNLIKVTKEEMYKMFPNVFSLSPEKVISEKQFTRLNNELRKKGIEVIEVEYAEVSKLSGLFRCSTLPLRRRY